MDMSLSKLWETVKDWEACLQSMGSQRVGHNLVMEQQQQGVMLQESYGCPRP